MNKEQLLQFLDRFQDLGFDLVFSIEDLSESEVTDLLQEFKEAGYAAMLTDVGFRKEIRIVEKVNCD